MKTCKDFSISLKFGNFTRHIECMSFFLSSAWGSLSSFQLKTRPVTCSTLQFSSVIWLLLFSHPSSVVLLALLLIMKTPDQSSRSLPVSFLNLLFKSLLCIFAFVFALICKIFLPSGLSKHKFWFQEQLSTFSNLPLNFSILRHFPYKAFVCPQWHLSERECSFSTKVLSFSPCFFQLFSLMGATSSNSSLKLLSLRLHFNFFLN